MYVYATQTKRFKAQIYSELLSKIKRNVVLCTFNSIHCRIIANMQLLVTYKYLKCGLDILIYLVVVYCKSSLSLISGCSISARVSKSLPAVSGIQNHINSTPKKLITANTIKL